MKKTFIYILLLLSIFFAACSAKTIYSVEYNKDGYSVEEFDLSKIQIKCIKGSIVTYKNITSEMLSGNYDFNKAGTYSVTVSYKDYSEVITLTLVGKDSPVIDPPIVIPPVDDLGAELNDPISLGELSTTLYVGNTVKLINGYTYLSSNPKVVKISDNNVVICLEKGNSKITDDNGNSVDVEVQELKTNASTYYSTIGCIQEMTASDLKTILHNIIDEHNSGSYNLLKTILPLSDADPNDPSKMILLYTGRSQGGPITSNNGADDWNREHVWPLSRLGGDTGLTAGHDAHHIRPADVSLNALRGNLDFGMGGSDVSDTYGNGSTHCKIDEHTFEPRDEVKGDIARMLFYMAVRYEGDVSGEYDLELITSTVGSSSNYTMGNLEILLLWNEQDPVDDFEINRNNVIYSYQRNRNPFIDYPSLANLIFGDIE